MKNAPVSAPQSVAHGLAEFKERHGVSTRDLSAICGGSGVLSKSSADRICRGVADIRYVRLVTPKMIEGISHFLAKKGYTHDQIREELLKIFPPEELKTMIATRTAIKFEVYSHFSLRRDPFALENDPRTGDELFTTPALDRLFNRILDAVNYQGMLAVVGDIGTGKTFLKKRLEDHVAQQGGRMQLVYPKFANMERVHAGAIVSFLLETFEQKPRRSLVAAQRQLEEYLEQLSERGVRVALGFDECHHLSDATLTAIKNFYELGRGYDRHLAIIMFGWERFRAQLHGSVKYREMAERVEVIEMPPLGKHAAEYLAFRVRLAGGDAERVFDRGAIKQLAARASTPLALGNLANAAMQRAYNLGERRVLAEHVDDEEGEPRVRAVRRAS